MSDVVLFILRARRHVLVSANGRSVHPVGHVLSILAVGGSVDCNDSDPKRRPDVNGILGAIVGGFHRRTCFYSFNGDNRNCCASIR